MPSSTLCLPKGTVAQVRKQPDKSTYYRIQIFGTTVGVCRSPELPPHIVLPAGLEVGATSASQEEVLSGETSIPEVVTVRYRSLLSVRPDAIEETAQLIENSRLIVIDGKVFGERTTLGDLVSKRGTKEVCEAIIFSTSDVKGGVIGLTIAAADAGTVAAKECAVDAVAYCSLDASREDVLKHIAAAVRRILTATIATTSDRRVRLAHFPVFGDGFVLSIVVAAIKEKEKEDEAEASQLAWRKRIHEDFLLPMDRPLLRESCQVYSAINSGNELSDGGWPGRLADVHDGVKSHGLGDGGVTVHLVQGKYLYCHYMQDKFNDSGWGCAYRSLQTIFSWCALQRYATFADGIIPTHRDIQKALVSVGDKPSSFLDSKEWIGANEVCYALERVTGISSKILHVSSGAEMEAKGRELARHFDGQGSPVMVGGGVLAWTILGVARNERTGKTKFLILDPHYEGRDDLKTIQGKGWVGWKSANIFKADAFYNLCMPLRPSGV